MHGAKIEKRGPTPIESELVAQLDQAADRLLFLSEVSRVLSRALTDKECFDRLLALIVPKVADWATLVIIKDDRNETRRVATAHIDPRKRHLLEAFGTKCTPRLDDPVGPGLTMREGRSKLTLHPQIEEFLRQAGKPELNELVKELGVLSGITVPLIADNRVFGAIWMATSDSGRVFTQDDLKLAEEVAYRAAYPAYHLLRYAQVSENYERLQIEVDVREQFLSNLRDDIRAILKAAVTSAQTLEQNDFRKKEHARRILSTIEKASKILDKTNPPLAG